MLFWIRKFISHVSIYGCVELTHVQMADSSNLETQMKTTYARYLAKPHVRPLLYHQDID